MKIQYASDLHLEFIENRNELKANKIESKADILLLSGDIMPLNMIHHLPDFFDTLSKDFKTVYWIPGNHEYYGFDISKAPELLQNNASIRENIFLINNNVVTIEDVQIICSTMWTHIEPNNEIVILKILNDFSQIRNNDKRLTVADYNNMHTIDLNFIKDAIDRNSGQKAVVMTHHIPTLMNYPEQYKGHLLNEAFAVELHDYIYDSNINYWIYGHHHSNIPEFKIGNTVMLTNQMGYVSHNENKTFRQNAVFEI